jgi:selenide,water dikinase
VRGLPSFSDPNLLIGPELFSDAGVYRLADDLAIVQSTDFFAPIVDDPYAYGQIAAANALSDIYAMGAQPRTALNIVGFPQDLDLSILSEILRGGADKVREAGAVLLGGHSVRDAEIKYGLAVTGTVNPAHMITNQGARPGDALVLTKALGTGFITTANKADRCPPDVLAGAVESMTMLNAGAAAAAIGVDAKAATDITGFGLAGHALELAEASGVSLRISLRALPLLAGTDMLVESASGANTTNREHTIGRIRFEAGEGSTRAAFLFDPQTSGGLLIAVPAARADELIRRLHIVGGTAAARIGEVVDSDSPGLVITE